MSHIINNLIPTFKITDALYGRLFLELKFSTVTTIKKHQSQQFQSSISDRIYQKLVATSQQAPCLL